MLSEHLKADLEAIIEYEPYKKTKGKAGDLADKRRFKSSNTDYGSQLRAPMSQKLRRMDTDMQKPGMSSSRWRQWEKSRGRPT